MKKFAFVLLVFAVSCLTLVSCDGVKSPSQRKFEDPVFQEIRKEFLTSKQELDSLVLIKEIDSVSYKEEVRILRKKSVAKYDSVLVYRKIQNLRKAKGL